MSLIPVNRKPSRLNLKVIIIEGILLLTDKRLRGEMIFYFCRYAT